MYSHNTHGYRYSHAQGPDTHLAPRPQGVPPPFQELRRVFQIPAQAQPRVQLVGSEPGARGGVTAPPGPRRQLDLDPLGAGAAGARGCTKARPNATTAATSARGYARGLTHPMITSTSTSTTTTTATSTTTTATAAACQTASTSPTCARGTMRGRGAGGHQTYGAEGIAVNGGRLALVGGPGAAKGLHAGEVYQLDGGLEVTEATEVRPAVVNQLPLLPVVEQG
jgi:hypothetical protein